MVIYLEFCILMVGASYPKCKSFNYWWPISRVSFVALTETWTNKNTEDQLQLKGYTAVYSSREDRIGGGVAIMVRENIKYFPLDLGISPKSSILVSVLSKSKRNLILVGDFNIDL